MFLCFLIIDLISSFMQLSLLPERRRLASCRLGIVCAYRTAGGTSTYCPRDTPFFKFKVVWCWAVKCDRWL